MNAQELWNVFIETGAPEAYLLYSRAKRMEDVHVFDNQSTGSPDNGLQ